MIRVAIVGAGSIADEIHIPAWRAVPNVELVAVCDVDPRRAQALATRSRVPLWLANIDELAASHTGVDVVDIATPPNTHEAVGLRALRLGYHVMIEKPAALSADGLEQLRSLARERGLRAWTAQSYRFRDAALLADRARKTGRLGLIEQVTIRSHGDDAFRKRSGWEWPEARDQLLLYELGIHYLDLAVGFAGNPTQVRGIAVRRDWAGNITSLYAIVEHDSEAHTIVDIRVDCSNRFVQVDVSGTNNDAVIRLYPEDIAIVRGQNTPLADLVGDFRRLSRFAGGRWADWVRRRPVKRRAVPHYRLFREFIAAIEGGAPDLPSDLDSVVPTFRLLDMLHQAALSAPRGENQTGAPVV